MSGEKMKWCSIWGNAMSITDHKVETYSKDLTLRYPITVPFSGDKIKLTFDNFCGTEEVCIEEVYISSVYKGENTGNEINKDTVKLLTFNGSKSFSMQPGQRVMSDEIDVKLSQNDSLVVSFYIKDFAQMRSSVIATGPLSRGYYAVGNHCQDEILPMDFSRGTNCFYFLSDVFLWTAEKNHAVVCYGDSITAQDWPDYLMKLYLKNENNNVAIVRKAASGTRVLRQYTNITYESYGLKADVRFPHEMPVEGADAIIIQQGINDIIHPVGVDVNPFRPMSDLPSVEELEAGLQYYVDEAKRQGLKIYMGTLLPIEGWRTYADFREVMKNEINDWIRAKADTVLIDFDKAVRDEKRPQAFKEGYDSGDHLHPSATAYERMALEAYNVLKLCEI